jgi:hypothetical protein
MREICIHIPPNKLEARLVDIRWNQNQSGPPVEVPICPSLPIDAAQFAQNKPLDPAAIRGLFTANHESPDFPARGRDLLAELGAGPAWWEVFQQTGELRSYLCVEHPLLRELPWELLTYNVNPLFSSSPWTRVQGWPLTHAPSNPVWPIRVFVIDGTDPEDKALTADSEIWGIRCALRAAEHSFDLEVLRTGIDPNFDVARLEDLMTRMEDGVRKWPEDHIFCTLSDIPSLGLRRLCGYLFRTRRILPAPTRCGRGRRSHILCPGYRSCDWFT